MGFLPSRLHGSPCELGKPFITSHKWENRNSGQLKHFLYSSEIWNKKKTEVIKYEYFWIFKAVCVIDYWPMYMISSLSMKGGGRIQCCFLYGWPILFFGTGHHHSTLAKVTNFLICLDFKNAWILVGLGSNCRNILLTLIWMYTVMTVKAIFLRVTTGHQELGTP